MYQQMARKNHKRSDSEMGRIKRNPTAMPVRLSKEEKLPRPHSPTRSTCHRRFQQKEKTGFRHV